MDSIIAPESHQHCQFGVSREHQTSHLNIKPSPRKWPQHAAQGQSSWQVSLTTGGNARWHVWLSSEEAHALKPNVVGQDHTERQESHQHRGHSKCVIGKIFSFTCCWRAHSDDQGGHRIEVSSSANLIGSGQSCGERTVIIEILIDAIGSADENLELFFDFAALESSASPKSISAEQSLGFRHVHLASPTEHSQRHYMQYVSPSTRTTTNGTTQGHDTKKPAHQHHHLL